MKQKEEERRGGGGISRRSAHQAGGIAMEAI